MAAYWVSAKADMLHLLLPGYLETPAFLVQGNRLNFLFSKDLFQCALKQHE